MKIAVTGANGLFGRGLVQVIGKDHLVVPMTRAAADLTDAGAVRNVLQAIAPDALIHTAGMPDPDLCERDPELAFRANVLATRNIVEVAREIGFPVAHISTDAVFDGSASTPRTESDPTRPISVYGRSKLQAEKEVLRLDRSWVFRVSVLFGPGKQNFVEKGLRLIESGATYTVASDQVGTATYTLDATRKILEVIQSGRHGLFHLCNQGACSRLELAQEAARLTGLPTERIRGARIEAMNRPGPRPRYAVMEMQSLRDAGIAPPRNWRLALADHLASEAGHRQ